MTNKSETDHEIVLTLTPFEASVIATVLMHKVCWAASGQFGDAAREIYWALDDAGVQHASWTTIKGSSINWAERV